jgi:hypothetical protein
MMPYLVFRSRSVTIAETDPTVGGHEEVPTRGHE